MKKVETTLYGIPLTITCCQSEHDQFDAHGHFTVKGRWVVETVEHKGEDIFNLCGNYELSLLEKFINDEKTRW